MERSTNLFTVTWKSPSSAALPTQSTLPPHTETGAFTGAFALSMSWP